MVSTGGRKAGDSTRICLVSWEWGQGVRRGPNRLSVRAGDETADLEEEEERSCSASLA